MGLVEGGLFSAFFVLVLATFILTAENAFLMPLTFLQVRVNPVCKMLQLISQVRLLQLLEG